MNKNDLIQLQEFRAMQLALKGALVNTDFNSLILEGIDKINIGDELEITEISLDTDCIVVSIGCAERYAPLSSFSQHIIDDIISTMRYKALDIANKDVMITADKL